MKCCCVNNMSSKVVEQAFSYQTEYLFIEQIHFHLKCLLKLTYPLQKRGLLDMLLLQQA